MNNNSFQLHNELCHILHSQEPSHSNPTQSHVCTKFCTGNSSNMKVIKPHHKQLLTVRGKSIILSQICAELACPQLCLAKHHLPEPLELSLLHALSSPIQTLSQNKPQPTFSMIYISIQTTQDKNIYTKKPRPATALKTQFILSQYWVC